MLVQRVWRRTHVNPFQGVRKRIFISTLFSSLFVFLSILCCSYNRGEFKAPFQPRHKEVRPLQVTTRLILGFSNAGNWIWSSGRAKSVNRALLHMTQHLCLSDAATSLIKAASTALMVALHKIMGGFAFLVLIASGKKSTIQLLRQNSINGDYTWSLAVTSNDSGHDN